MVKESTFQIPSQRRPSGRKCRAVQIWHPESHYRRLSITQSQTEQAGLVLPNPVRVNHYAINWIAPDLS